MALADVYRQYAAECLCAAQLIQDPTDKAILLEMAVMWRRLAEKAAANEAPAPDGKDAG
jgi:hypothetical protein